MCVFRSVFLKTVVKTYFGNTQQISIISLFYMDLGSGGYLNAARTASLRKFGKIAGVLLQSCFL